ncbi:MAG: flagellar motor switch protein FliN [Lentisphaeria bacterium]|nr:flagellar motor switch protein FliN [Lentisphaeria bacterium]NQZ70180.1 flagellar motor switch protein FliN [Lentisphaeria bacterium]
MSDEVSTAAFSEVNDFENSGSSRNLEIVSEIPVLVSAELGHTKIPIRELMQFGPGSVVELDRLAGESIDLLVNGILIGRGDVVIVNENFGLRITEVLKPEDRLRPISE